MKLNTFSNKLIKCVLFKHCFKIWPLNKCKMGTTNTAMLEGRITFRTISTTTDFIAIRNVFKYDDEYKHIRGWLLLINVCVCHNTQNEPKLDICLI